MTPSMVYPILIVLLAVVRGIVCVEFTVRNDALSTPGGKRFENVIGQAYIKATMIKSSNFIWNMFKQQNAQDKNTYNNVEVVVYNYNGGEAYTSGSIINISALYVQGYQGNVKWEITSLVYHEMTHVWQWDGAGKAPVGLVEGVADYTILKANYYPPAFAKPGTGDKWDQGYDITARFLEYCESLKPGFVAALNKKMKDTYNVQYFKDLLGKSVDQLWKEYKAKYSGGKVVEKLNLEEIKPRKYSDRYLV
ncbi:uncharacterized protein LOC124935516 [Impatiens glandulifera]|uniref:uncharacterized protein LOC124935516 n=1 Tax=Impatiens glandulifera TaxID=253017 RepID=UPI001FB135F6|nr:uncharacterized protein LOC124935516 [Impatiens glandulifera]